MYATPKSAAPDQEMVPSYTTNLQPFAQKDTVQALQDTINIDVHSSASGITAGLDISS